MLVLEQAPYAGSLENGGRVERPPPTFLRETSRTAGGAAIFNEHRPTAVVNFAAESHVDRSIDDAGDSSQTNIVGAFGCGGGPALLRGLGEDERRGFPLSCTSRRRGLRSRGEGLFSRLRPTPELPYAASKAGADHLVAPGTRPTACHAATNCSNNYGPTSSPRS